MKIASDRNRVYFLNPLSKEVVVLSTYGYGCDPAKGLSVSDWGWEGGEWEIKPAPKELQ